MHGPGRRMVALRGAVRYRLPAVWRAVAGFGGPDGPSHRGRGPGGLAGDHGQETGRLFEGAAEWIDITMMEAHMP
ncbi:hypothetical protein DESC_720466 [Desulfosarcina cetonica]|nr:hypothetical protein DESC_720466 [Desulfosarcina cetonica]